MVVLTDVSCGKCVKTFSEAWFHGVAGWLDDTAVRSSYMLSTEENTQRKNFIADTCGVHLDAALESGSWKPSFQFNPRAVDTESSRIGRPLERIVIEIAMDTTKWTAWTDRAVLNICESFADFFVAFSPALHLSLKNLRFLCPFSGELLAFHAVAQVAQTWFILISYCISTSLTIFPIMMFLMFLGLQAFPMTQGFDFFPAPSCETETSDAFSSIQVAKQEDGATQDTEREAVTHLKPDGKEETEERGKKEKGKKGLAWDIWKIKKILLRVAFHFSTFRCTCYRKMLRFEQCHLPLAISFPAPKINRDCMGFWVLLSVSKQWSIKAKDRSKDPEFTASAQSLPYCIYIYIYNYM